jgi:uncharacterized protein
MSAQRSKFLLLLLLLVPALPAAAAQDFDFRAPASSTDPQLPALMRDLAGRILPVYQENDPERFLSNLSALQMVAGDYPSAYATRQSLLERRRNTRGGRPVGRALVYDIYSRARTIETQVRVPFTKAYAQAFRDAANRLDDLDAYTLEGWLTTPLPVLQEGLQRALEQRRGKTSLSLNEALDLIWAYFAYDAYRSFGPLVASLAANEDARRYITDDDAQIKMRDGAMLSAVVVRPRLSSKRLTTLLELTLQGDVRSARGSAAHGYVGVSASVRRARGEPGRIVPFDGEGDDARAVIEWASRQPWSDGRVGLYGDRYGGYVAWAAAKRLPAAVKAIATSDASAPAVDVPMAGSIFRNSAYRWVYELGTPPEERAINDDAGWRALDEDWYKHGRRYREYPKLPGKPSALFRSWLNHPSYDRTWQKLLPFGEEFARIDIPVLSMTGYFADGEMGTLYYFTEHQRHNPRANHTLFVGPYDDGAIHRTPSSVLRGYVVDPAAVVDLRELRYEWFDYVLKGAKRPALLADRVNYQVMESNEWRHAPSLEALEQQPLRFYLEPTPGAEVLNRLVTEKSGASAFLPQLFDLADRSDVGWRPSAFVVTRTLKPPNGELYVSEPLKQPLEVAGLLTGTLDLTVNKMDMDLSLSLYELRPDGEYINLFDPAYAFRASYARDRVKRHLLRAGKRQQLPFRSERLMGRKLAAGSRVVLVLGINKRADQQLNYGTGDDVSEESIEDADVPLKIRWYNSSYIDVPVRR